MGVSVEWEDKDSTIVHLTYSGRWTTEEMHSAGLQSLLMVRSVKHPVYVINDFSKSETLPVGVLWQARQLNQMRAPNWAASILITEDTLAINLLELFGLIYLSQRRKRLFAVRTLEEAVKIIDQLKRDEQVQ